MNRTWLVFWRTFWGHITRPAYLLFTFGLPAFVILFPVVGGLILVLIIRSALPATDPRPVGFVDEAGFFAEGEPYPDAPVRMIVFADPEQAGAALDRGEIQAYYVVAGDYPGSGEITMVYEVVPTIEVDTMFSDWVDETVEARVPERILHRYEVGALFQHQAQEGEAAFNALDFVKWALAYGVIYFTGLASSITAAYMYDSLALEARDRTIEILLTSVSPMQFLVGKFLALVLAGVLQLFLWGAPLILTVAVVLNRLASGLFLNVIPWEQMGLIVSMLFGFYLLWQAFAAISALLRLSGGAGPQLFGLIEWAVGFGMIYASVIVPRNPDTPLAVAASLFPFTAPLALLLRVLSSEVPQWQIVTSQGLLWGSLGLSFWVMQWMLKRNLVAYAPRFKVRSWLKGLVTKRAKIQVRQG